MRSKKNVSGMRAGNEEVFSFACRRVFATAIVAKGKRGVKFFCFYKY